jgi:kynurenine formamidase
MIDTTKFDTIKIINNLQLINLNQKIVLIYTGHAHKFGTLDYYQNYPVLDQRIAQALTKHSPRMIAFDTPSPDATPYYLHQLFLSNQILIAENLTNLEPLLSCKRFEITALPLKTVSDSAPARIIAKIIE